MKKLSLLVGGLILSTAVMAQKPDASVHNTLEGVVSWNASTLSFASPSIRYRYFVQDNIAVRVSLGVHNTSTTENFNEFGDGTGGTGTYESKTGAMNFSVGGEYHFGGTDRLSPYAGLDIMLGSGKVTNDGTNSDGASFIDAYTESSEAKTSMFGVALVAGTDFYFAENFYAGLELGLGWSSMTWKEGEATTTFGGTTTTSVTPESKASGINTNSMVSGSLRLGWRF